MIQVTVKFFAIARDLAHAGDASFSLENSATTEHLLGEIIRKYPQLAGWRPYLRLAVNQSYVASGVSLHEGDEVAVIPPVSGG